MKKFYKKIRIALMTFAFGLATVFIFQGSLESEIEIELPQFQSEQVIFIEPVRGVCIISPGGHGDVSEIEIWKENCLPEINIAK